MPRVSRWTTAAFALAAAGVFGGCGAKRVELPSGAGSPSSEAPAAYTSAVKECRGVRTLQATLGLSGKAGGTPLRGNVDAGFEAPERIRLEGRAPLGRPVFILVAGGAQTILYLPRDNRVMRDVKPASIVEALVGLPLTPGELRAIVSGCGFGAGDPSQGHEYSAGQLAVDVGGATVYLRQQEGAWRVEAAVRPPLTVLYSSFVNGRPAAVRVISTGEPRADMTVRLSDVNINVTMENDVFAVDVPAAAQPLTIEELRRAGPLGGE